MVTGMRTQATYIVDRFGGLTALARSIGKTASVVQGWKERGTIPAKHYPAILDAGSALDPPLTMSEFVEDADGARHSFDLSEAAE